MNKTFLILVFISLTFSSCTMEIKPTVTIDNHIKLTIDGENLDGAQGEWIITTEDKKENGKDIIVITIEKNKLD
jgi:hypothetical protein